jgi:hypothetical protein
MPLELVIHTGLRNRRLSHSYSIIKRTLQHPHHPSQDSLNPNYSLHRSHDTIMRIMVRISGSMGSFRDSVAKEKRIHVVG